MKANHTKNLTGLFPHFLSPKVNSKVYLISEGGHTLAESFMKLSSSRAQPASNPDRLNYMKVHPEFSLDEDEQIEFDPVEDSELRPSSYMARVVELVKVETENVPLLPPLNTNARQDLHKRKMEYLDQTIQQFSKRTKRGSSPQRTKRGSSPQTSQFSDPITPSTPIPAASRRKMTGFETRPFNSPLINKLKQFDSTDTPTLERFRPPLVPKPSPSVVSRLQSRPEPHIEDNQNHVVRTELEDGPGSKDSSSSALVQPRPRNHPPVQPKRKIQEAEGPSDPTDNLINRSKLKDTPPSTSDRVSNQKTLKVDWDSFFQAAKPS